MSQRPTPAEIEAVLEHADLLHSEQAVQAAMDAVAIGVTARLSGRDPLVLCVMNGGLMVTTWLASRLNFPFEMDYIHATRYRGGTMGHDLEWIARPRTAMAGRSVLLVDDIFDEGITLASIAKACHQAGAREVFSAVLVRKDHGRVSGDYTPDFIGLEVPDRYVFGCGMDYRHYLRNLPAIYALADDYQEHA